MVTAIVYANGDWDEGDDGGELLIYPDTARREELNAGELARAVEVAPLGGRLVVFDSYLWHGARESPRSAPARGPAVGGYEGPAPARGTRDAPR